MQNSLQPSTGVREAERNNIETQSERKREKQTLDKLHHREMFESEACLKTCSKTDNELRQITSIIWRKAVMKEQIKVRVLGLGWDDWHHPWSAAGHEFKV